MNTPKHGRSELTWSREDLDRFGKIASRDPLYCAFALVAQVDITRAELLALRWVDLALDARTVRTPRHLVCSGGELRLTQAAASRRDRSLEISEGLTEAFRWLACDARLRHFGRHDAWSEYDLVFSGATGEPLHPRRVSDHFARLVRSAGLPPMTMACLRATYGIAHPPGAPVGIPGHTHGPTAVSV